MDRRIYGLETEFSISFEPDSPHPDDVPPPRRKELFKVLREVLKREYALLPALYKKEGDFLENGSLLHYEAQIQHFQEGLVEWATAECAGPEDLLVHSKAQEEALVAVGAACREELASRGHPGSLRVLKNNVDLLGNNYGCHENYLVADSRPWPREVLKGVCFALFWLVFLPFFVLPRLVFLLFLTLLLALLLVYFALNLLARVPVLGWLFEPLVGGVNAFLARYGARLDEELIKNLALFMEFLYLPFVHLYSLFCRCFVFERYRRYLTAFLVTRQIYAGSGRVHPTEQGELFWLSQKGEFVRSVLKVFWNQRTKPIYDIKNFLLEPLSFFSGAKRLHLLVGDSNLAEVSEYLKVAATGLVIQVIEESGGAGLPVLARPIEALRGVATDPALAGSWELADGRRLGAVAIQRAYLEAARAHFRERRTIPLRAPQVLELWQDVLDRLEESPDSLHQELDWVIKRRLMDRVLWGRTTWEELARWAPALAVLLERGLVSPLPADPFALVRALEARLPARRRVRLERHLAGLDRARLPEALSVLLALKKLDLKYHELSPDGYFRVLRDSGLVRRLADPQEVDRARTEPPPGTRARIRGEFVKLAARRKLNAFVGWTKIKTAHARKVIHLPDPFQTDSDELELFR